MGSFEIIVGQERSASAVPELGCRSAPGAARVDPARHRDVIDIFVDGANVSARAPADRVYPLIRELAGAVVDLASGNRHKVVVPFHEAPYELVLERKGSQALVTFYRGGNAPEVSVKDRAVPLDDVRRAVSSAAQSVCERLWKDGHDDPRCAELLDLSRRTRDGMVSPARPGSLAKTRRMRSRWFAEAPQGARLAFGFEAELSAARPSGADSGAGVRADLHPLLFRGRLAVHVAGTRTVFSEGYLFLRVERLVQACRHLAEASETGRAMSVRLESDGLLVGVRREAGESACLSLSEVEVPVPLVVRADNPRELVDAVALLARELRRALAEVGEGRNLRVRELSRMARSSRSQLSAMTRQAPVECEDPDAYRSAARGSSVPPVPQDAAPGALASARRLGFVERWRLEAEGLDLSSTFLCGDRLIVTAKKSLCAIDRDRGDVLWRREVPRATTLVAGDGILRLRQDGRATMHELDDGEPRWSIELSPRAGGAPIAVAPAGLDAPPIAAVAEGKRTLTGLDLRTGERRWQFVTRRSGAFKIRRTGRLLHLTCGDPAVHALDLITGELAWRYTTEERFKDRPVLAKDALLVSSTLPSGRSVLHALDAFSGRLLWKREMSRADAPIPVAGTVVVAIAGPDGLTFQGLSATTGERLWDRALPEAGPGYQALGVDGALVVNTASGRCVALDAGTGQNVWAADLGRLRDVPRRLEPVLRGGALFVPSQSVCVLRPSDGAIIHRLAPGGPIPDFLRVDERFALYVGEDSGFLVCYAMGARLALVRS